MNFIDITIIILLLWAIYKGFTKGFIVQVASLVALLLGIWGAIHFSGYTADFITEKFKKEFTHLAWIAFALTFIGIIIVVHLVARLIEKLVESIALGFLNRIGGVVFSILKVSLVLSVVIMLAKSIDEKVKLLPEKEVDESVFFKPLSKLAPAMFPYLKILIDKGKDHADQLNDMVT